MCVVVTDICNNINRQTGIRQKELIPPCPPPSCPRRTSALSIAQHPLKVGQGAEHDRIHEGPAEEGRRGTPIKTTDAFRAHGGLDACPQRPTEPTMPTFRLQSELHLEREG